VRNSYELKISKYLSGMKNYSNVGIDRWKMKKSKKVLFGASFLTLLRNISNESNRKKAFEIH
jgi:hypothetical protein